MVCDQLGIGALVVPRFKPLNYQGNPTNKSLKRFSLRGKAKVQGQRQLFCLIHNLDKLKNYGQLAA
jgi:hypothetical protein